MTDALYVVGEPIAAGLSVVLATDGKLYRAGWVSGVLVGNTAEALREGFRAMVRGGEVREDDA